jgi:hypothetical protein
MTARPLPFCQPSSPATVEQDCQNPMAPQPHPFRQPSSPATGDQDCQKPLAPLETC